MKSFLALALTPLLSPAQESPVPTFPDLKIESGPLSLLDAARQSLPPIFGQAPAPAFHTDRHPRNQRRAASNMPIVTPKPNVEYHLRVVKPDESVDYKLTVKTPEVESSK